MSYKQTDSELERHLDEQLGFLTASCGLFDAGNLPEGRRLAGTLRTLLKDNGRNSVSVLSHVDRKEILFPDTAQPLQPMEKVLRSGQFGLIVTFMGDNGTRVIAPLDNNPVRAWMNFDEWWDSEVMVDTQGNRLSRKQLVLHVAEKDGGVHVDGKLPDEYAGLSRRNSLGWYIGSQPIQNAELYAVRQIAHEVLKAMDNGYSNEPDLESGILVGGIAAIGTVPTGSGTTSKPRRNDICPFCESGRKYKKCCGAAIR